MSILNCYVGPSHALVAVDTRSIDDAGNAVHVQKIMILPHLNAAIAFRGSLFFQALALANIYVSGLELEELFAAASSLLSNARKNALAIAENQEHANLDRLRGRQEAVLVGWSIKESRMLGCVYQNELLKNEFAEQLIESEHCYKSPFDPEHPEGVPEMPCSTVDEIINLARKQKAVAERYRACELGAPGGNLLIARIDGDGVAIRSVCNLDEPAVDLR